MRGLDGKKCRWDEILRDILNGKLKIVQNRKTSISESEDDDDYDDEEMPEEVGNRSYDTSEREGRYEPIRTNPEEDVIQIHMANFHRVRIMKIKHGDLTETQINRKDTVV